MCTLVLLRRPGHSWPVLVAANRDEMAGRPWRAPARHWPDREEVVAGLDERGGGSWLGVNDHGLMAALLNGRDTLGPAPDKRSRGELVLEALDHADADLAAEALADLAPDSYRGFHLVLADNREAFRVSSDERTITVATVPEGLSVFTEAGRNELTHPRVAAYLPRFQAAAVPDPDADTWSAWETLLAGRDCDPEAGPEGAMCVVKNNGFQTVSSSLMALSASRQPPAVWRFAPGAPDRTAFCPVLP